MVADPILVRRRGNQECEFLKLFVTCFEKPTQFNEVSAPGFIELFAVPDREKRVQETEKKEETGVNLIIGKVMMQMAFFKQSELNTIPASSNGHVVLAKVWNPGH